MVFLREFTHGVLIAVSLSVHLWYFCARSDTHLLLLFLLCFLSPVFPLLLFFFFFFLLFCCCCCRLLLSCGLFAWVPTQHNNCNVFSVVFFPDARYPTVRNPRPQPAAAAVALNRASTRSIKTTKVNSGAGRKRLTLSSSTPFSCLSWLPRVTLR